ncbi:diaminopimelate decarboxylase [Pseudalkalibacillus hwajinpoensis]|uniref:Diaminopimelate decarboxylase n=1 Tax=Guptibacillus hwajinpoensis TaxID=208199 RepID=A0A4U1MFB1_9BACL|nr:diaminopimelate decarboxylase [Pseudalkalibacillus hwajinpoensis]TKD69909.1 diaminopimelate decarboxylase [Pseudalkalibacillus hwajinpoensis]
MNLYGTSTVSEEGHLTIGGVDTVQLGKKFGTALYVYDVSMIREKARAFRSAFERGNINYQVAYASKAFSCVAMIQLAEEEGLSLDVVSGGELYTALQAGFPVERIHFHGNNKSEAEIRMALDAEIGCFVVDNFYELSLLEQLSEEKGVRANILLRITPGIEAHTHDYILTGQEDSKFGFDLQSGQVEEAIKSASEMKQIHLLGLHCHIGSQIFETTGFVMAIEKIYSYLSKWYESFGFGPEVLNLGGGFGIRYTSDDEPLPVEDYIEAMIKTVKSQLRTEMNMPEIWIEPGRSLVGEAGITLYTVGSHKQVPELRNYLAVDGGMSDNLRPALYQAKYEATIANRMYEPSDHLYSVAGKCCESGDMIIWDCELQRAIAGDTMAVFSTGAYGYSMANNYNRLPRPAVVFVENGEASLVVRRESYEDLIRHDLPLKQAIISK